ncbi:class I SAM-dependent methyltransferase [Methylobacterium radiodurans]|uniref:Methyltransferase type 12 domain-containing protein n=1 Tax=Methylobacterium radiodurans TaxID=2202828 RepID=A0A2U8VUX8_9HYPH|nr:class I SAM-dependent methyltransferase [Methylobacterium radiodurans]AWN37261.1 hypothetical protein DK427_17275 [Methylobacterium radiodurans]
MLFRFRSAPPRHRAHLWDRVPETGWGDTLQTLEAVTAAWRRYAASPLDAHVSAHEDMIGTEPGAAEGYRLVGLTALRAVTEAMLLTGRTRFDDILDLPCGAGRVTRHLRAFFPEARLHAADIDRAKLADVVRQFGAEPFDCPPDFRGDPARRFDLIFSGSLLTHFDADLFEHAVDFFVRALEPGGIAILTLHGRSSATLSSAPEALARQERVAADFRAHMKQEGKRYRVKLDAGKALADFAAEGFGYYMSPAWTSMYGQSYGGSYSAPAWVMRLFERRADCLVVGFKEKSYGDMQDVVTVRKL